MLFCECHVRPSEADGEFSAQLVLYLVTGLVPLAEILQKSNGFHQRLVQSCPGITNPWAGCRQSGTFHQSG